jgi:hypothetical protein
VQAEDDAERVTGGVSEDPEARLSLTWNASGAQGEQFLLGLVGVSDADVEVQLLGMRRVRPARRNPFGDPLKGQLPKAGLSADYHPAVDVLVDSHPQHLAVEQGQSARVGAVDHCLFEASDHTASMLTATFPLIGRSVRLGAQNTLICAPQPVITEASPAAQISAGRRAFIWCLLPVSSAAC